MTRARAIAVLACALALPCVKAHAAAPEPKESGALGVTVSAVPVFGVDAATGSGWMEIVARIENGSGTAQKGTLELSSAPSIGGGEYESSSRAPFNVAAGRGAIVKVPTHGFAYYVPQLLATVIGENGTKLSTVNVNLNGTSSPLLVDVDQPSRLSVPMRGWPIHAKWNPGSALAGYTTSALTVGSPAFDRTTGDPILPDRAAGYSAVTVLLIHSDTLTTLEEGKQDALVGWVLAGGTLAVVPSRPEDLRASILTTLTGGTVAKGPPPAALAKLPAVERPSSAPQIGSTADPNQDDTEDEGTPKADAPPTLHTLRVGPSTAVQAKLTGYQGGNLHASDFGASARYGNGEVHLLAFDPTVVPMLDDAWVHSRVVDMVARAWDRHAKVAFPLGGGDLGSGHMDEVRRALDPNENFRVGLAISAVLLVLYSLIAGPLTFLRATKRGTPMAPLVWAPVWSAIAFSAIVLVGLAGKGWRGRARHLSLVEASGGSARGTVRRFRGFFASEARSLAVAASERASVLEVAPTDGGRSSLGVLRFDRDGVTLGDLTSLPWQTIVVREDAFLDLKKGITLEQVSGGGLEIVNRSGRMLKDVVARAPHGPLFYVTTIADGETARANDGRALVTSSSSAPERTTSAGLLPVHPLGAREIQAMLGAHDGERFGNVWAALENAAGESIDWWPESTAIVMGEMIDSGPLGKDAGLSLESDRVMFRVIGMGGGL